jgi:choline dehydrogenase-like flavoprotein
MFLDARTLRDGAVVQADVCIIGAGAAGIPLALRFADGPVQVALLEAGGMIEDGGGRGIHQVVYAPIPRLAVDPTRTSCFGGNTNHWLGNCRPLDESDFAEREWIPHSGWPIRRDALLSFYEQAQTLCGLGAFRYYDVDACRPHLSHPPIATDPAILTNKMVHTSPVASFDVRYRDRLRNAGNVRVYLRAEAIRLRANARGDCVRTVEVGAGDGTRFRVAARAVVLAAGGIENPRLLLCSSDKRAEGLASEDAVVGRFFMEHPFVDIPLGPWQRGAELLSARDRQVEGTAVWEHLVLSDELMRSERLCGLSLWVLPSSVFSALSTARIENLWLARARLADLSTEAPSLCADAAAAAGHAWQRLARRSHAASADGYTLRVALEQTPDPSNRVQLSSQRDAFGRPGLDLRFRLTETDRCAAVRALRIAAGELGLNGRRIATRFDLLLRAGRIGVFWHHMGTTRMHADPARGVVDADCRVHGVSNLFIAGSSVFPTGGTAAPTLTIVALALRLADHLRAQCL